MKFLLDMGISPTTADFLRGQGNEASHLHHEGLEKLGDPEILSKARREGAVLLTHDLDFPDLLAASGARLPSIVVFRLRNMRPENVNRHLEIVLAQHGDVLSDGAILTVSEGGIRYRGLPIGERQ